MDKKKNKVEETGRWLRMGALSLGVLGPFMNILKSRVRTYTDAEEAVAALHQAEIKYDVLKAAEENVARQSIQEKLQAVGAAIADVLADMRETPSAQEMRQRSEGFVSELKERGNKFTQAVAERGGQLAEQSSKLSQDLAERGSKLTHDLSERGSELSQELTKRSRRASREMAEQRRSFWIAFGFGIGLTAAALLTYIFLRRRMQPQEEVDETPIQLKYDELAPSAPRTNQPRGEINAIGLVDRVNQNQASAPSYVAVADEPSTHSRPADAKLVGVVSTRRYYPVETPLDQLSTNGKLVDVVYFFSEEDARVQGFIPAEV